MVSCVQASELLDFACYLSVYLESEYERRTSVTMCRAVMD